MNDSGRKCYDFPARRIFYATTGTFLGTGCLNKCSLDTANRETLVLSGWEKGKRAR
jgi:hypothetical protein